MRTRAGRPRLTRENQAVPLHAEDQVNWIADAIARVGDHGCAAAADSVDGWVAECVRRADETLFTKANSWYMGANVPGKPRGFMLFVGALRPTTTSAQRWPTRATRASI